MKRWTWGAEPPSPRSLDLREVVARLQHSAKALHGLGICSCLLVIIVLCDEQRVFLSLALYTKWMGKEWADRAAEGGHRRAGEKTAFRSVPAHGHHRVMLYCVPPTVLARKTGTHFFWRVEKVGCSWWCALIQVISPPGPESLSSASQECSSLLSKLGNWAAVPTLTPGLLQGPTRGWECSARLPRQNATPCGLPLLLSHPRWFDSSTGWCGWDFIGSPHVHCMWVLDQTLVFFVSFKIQLCVVRGSFGQWTCTNMKIFLIRNIKKTHPDSYCKVKIYRRFGDFFFSNTHGLMPLLKLV